MRKDWKEVRIKDFCTYVSRGVTPNYIDSSDYLVVNQATFSKGFFDIENIRFTDNNNQNALLKDNDLLMASTGGGVLGKVHFYKSLDNREYYADSHVTILRSNKGNTKYLYYLFAINYDFINSVLAKGSTNQTELQRDKLLNYVFNSPPLPTQHAIANYLDKKLGIIDRQIALLEKKRDRYNVLRKSLINQTVRQGLDKSAETKDSGIEWLGKIPKHWEVKRFKDLQLSFFTGFTPEADTFFASDGDTTWVTIADMQNKYVNSSNIDILAEIADKKGQQITPKGSLLFSFKLSIGKIAFAEKDLYTNEAIVSILPTKLVCLEYLYYLLPITLFENATENIYGAKMLNQKIINNMLFPIPPLPEQRTIAEYLDTQSGKIDRIVDNINAQLGKLAQLKKSLINECVTGERELES